MMRHRTAVALLIPIYVLVTFCFHFSLILLGGNDDLGAHHQFAANFDAPKHNALLRRDVSNHSAKLTEGRQKSSETDKFDGMLPFEKLSSVDSFTCCGIGHRMTRVVNAAHVASQVNFTLRVFWDFCGDVEVFHHYFGPQPRKEVMQVQTTGKVLRLHNEVPGYRKLVREGPNAPCKCTQEKVTFDAQFYAGIRNRFRNKANVDSFVESNFSNHTVVGLHVRAGNGEQGDFVDKNRMINDTDIWVRRISDSILNMTVGWKRPPLLFLATDTTSMVDKFRTALNGSMNVISLPQHRSKEGSGVLFGERGVVHNATREKIQCLGGWNAVITDMLLLSHADVVIAARPSSFTQTLPMSLVLERPKETRNVLRSFCEFNPEGTVFRCFGDYMDWCCNGKGSFIFSGIKQRYDYPKVPYNLDKQVWNIKERPLSCNLTAEDGMTERDCIPFSWPPSTGE